MNVLYVRQIQNREMCQLSQRKVVTQPGEFLQQWKMVSHSESDKKSTKTVEETILDHGMSINMWMSDSNEPAAPTLRSKNSLSLCFLIIVFAV